MKALWWSVLLAAVAGGCMPRFLSPPRTPPPPPPHTASQPARPVAPAPPPLTAEQINPGNARTACNVMDAELNRDAQGPCQAGAACPVCAGTQR